MSATGLFNTSLMGMSAQTAALSAVAENISNSSTVGYKEATTHFLTLLTSFQGGEEVSGGVTTKTRFDITTQGNLEGTSSTTDLAIQGSGFFVVSNAAGEIFLTRAGSFVPDSQGRLVNAAGYYLMGYSGGPDSSSSSTGIAGMQVINVYPGGLIASPTASGALSVNLPANGSTIAAANLPSTNVAGAAYTSKTSLTVYDNLGNSVLLDVYFANQGSNNWEISVYNAADASAGGGFPYSSSALSTQTLTFSSANGSLISGSPLSVAVPGGGTMALDLASTTQLGAPFVINSVMVDGNAASAVSQIQVSEDGTLSYLLANGQTYPAYTIALANVNSPNNLEVLSGNVFAPTLESGQAYVGIAGTGRFGNILSSQLEASTVDLAAQLSAMIVAQRSYTANTQVFQVASEILQVLNNLK